MIVEIRLYATLNRYAGQAKTGQPILRCIPEGTTVGDLIQNELRIPPTEVKTAFVNGVSRPFDYVLADGDRVGLFPPVAGGQ